MVEQGWFFHCDNAPVQTVAIVYYWLAAHSIQVLRHPPYSLDLALADFFLLWRVKDELAGISLDHSILKKEWEGVMRSISAEEVRHCLPVVVWYERCQKCIDINKGYVEKSLEIKVLLTITVVHLF